MPAYTREGGLTPHITERICALALYAARTGADGILFTCSVFPQAEDMAKQLVRIPLLKPDEAMIAAALDAGHSDRGRGHQSAGRAGRRRAASCRREGARTGECTWSNLWPRAPSPSAIPVMPSTHDRMVVEAAERIAGQVDVLCLAQVSMALARGAVQATVKVPVLTSPATAVARLKMLLDG